MSRFKLPKGKVQLHVLISEDLYRELLHLAASRCRRHRGALSQLVEEALWHYLHCPLPSEKNKNSELKVRHTLRENAQNSTIKPNQKSFKQADEVKPSTTMRRLLKIAELMYQRHFTHAITVGGLKQIVMEVAGRTPSIVKSYAEALAEREVLKPSQVAKVKWSNPHFNTKILEVNFEALQTLLNHTSQKPQ